MTQNLSYPAHDLQDPIGLNRDLVRPQRRASAESLLRDIAFVLTMTQRVREEIETQDEVREPAPV